MAKKYFEGFDFTNFWDDCTYSREECISEPPTDFMIARVERELGYKLPASYIELMQMHNGGRVERNCFPSAVPIPSVAPNMVDIRNIYGIGDKKLYSLLGEFSTRHWVENWGYPDIGIAICDTPGAGHDMIFLDYRQCGPKGEPAVVHVDQSQAFYEDDEYPITFLAKDFETFIKSLCYEEDIEILD